MHKKPFIFLLNVFYIDCRCQPFFLRTSGNAFIIRWLWRDSDFIGLLACLFTCVVRLSQISFDIRFGWSGDAFSYGQRRCRLCAAYNCVRLFTEKSPGKQTMTMTNERIVLTFTVNIVSSFPFEKYFISMCICLRDVLTKVSPYSLFE